jgi:nucleoside-diphosphate-sugar epimerase
MKVVVTGAAGFIGTHLCTRLSALGVSVVKVDRAYGAHLESFSDARDAISQGQNADAIVHLASSCSTPGSVANPIRTFNDTVLAAVNVLELARRHEIPVILTSSVKARDGRTPYGAAKRMAETWAQEYHQAYGLPVLVNRPGTVYGPGQEGSPESGWVAWFCRARTEELPVVISGDGGQVRDLLHVSDYVNLLLQQLQQFSRFQSLDTIFDVGGGHKNTVTVRELADHLKLDYSFGPPRYGDSLCYVGYNNAPDWHPLVDWRESETLK